MKTLIINGSPRKNGCTASLLNLAKETLVGEIIEISAYHNNISPCIDCRACHKTVGCPIPDDFQLITADDFEQLIIASPIYMGNLTPPMLSILSRFQANYVAKRFLKNPITLRPKRAITILVGGGDGAPDEAIRQSRMLARSLNATLTDDDIITSLNTDSTPAIEDSIAIAKLKESLKRMCQS